MSSDAWPSPDSPRGTLPRIEDLPIVQQGYDQEAVRLAFDAFYRHAAQLDATLQALEAVEAFRRDADAVRNDLRALRALGGLGSSQSDWVTPRYERAPSGVAGVVLRLLAESALIIAVAVIAGVAHFRPAVIVALMAAAFVVVAFSEWLAGRARFVPPRAAAFLPDGRGEPAPYVEASASAPVWGVPLGPDEDTEAEALTMVGQGEAAELPEDADAARAAEPEPAEPQESELRPDPWEQGAAAGSDEPELAQGEGASKRRR
jgi:hypothetical protein